MVGSPHCVDSGPLGNFCRRLAGGLLAVIQGGAVIAAMVIDNCGGDNSSVACCYWIPALPPPLPASGDRLPWALVPRWAGKVGAQPVPGYKGMWAVPGPAASWTMEAGLALDLGQRGSPFYFRGLCSLKI